jgi:hypothetical protein
MAKIITAHSSSLLDNDEDQEYREITLTDKSTAIISEGDYYKFLEKFGKKPRECDSKEFKEKMNKVYIDLNRKFVIS